jgi:hypothetical protein
MAARSNLHKLALLVLAPLSVAACQREEARPVPAAEPAPAAPAPALPTALSRADILSALAAAASAHAARQTPDDAALTGRSFAIKLPFGCTGPAGETTPGGLAVWRPGDDGRSLTLSLSPADWTEGGPAGQAGDPPWARVDGYWISRPWRAAGECPPAPALASTSADPDGGAPASPPASALTDGLAVIHPEGGSRLGRRAGDAYRHVLRGQDGRPPATPTGGYRLVLEGRIAAFPDGRPIRCAAPGPDVRPTCVAAVSLDVVAFETADGVRLDEWRPDQGRAL